MNRTHPYEMALGEQAHRILVVITQRHHIEAGSLLRVIAESSLQDATSDYLLEETLIEDVQLLAVPGAFERKYWKEPAPRLDGLILDCSLGQEEAPDDVPLYVPPASYWRHRSMKPGKHRVTLEFNETAYAGLVIMKEYDERDSIEDVIYADLGGAVKSTLQCDSVWDWIEEQFGQE